MPTMWVKRENYRETKTGIMQKLLVYTHGGGALIGTGWVVHHEGKTSKPTLISLDGKPLAEEWYSILVTGESYLVVVNDTIQ